MMRHGLAAAALAALALTGCDDGPQRTQTMEWQARVAPESWVRVRNVNGPVTVRPATGDQVRITATKKWRGRGGERVRVAVVPDGSDLVVCALYGDGECSGRNYDSGQRGSSWWRSLLHGRPNASIAFVLEVPPGLRVDGNTVNGALDLGAPAREVAAETVNGRIRIAAARGPVRAETVNGSIVAKIDAFADAADVQLETVNGSITAELPPSLDAMLDLETVSGRLTSGFQGQLLGDPENRDQLKMRVGTGRGSVRAETVNGSITVRPAAGGVAAEHPRVNRVIVEHPGG